MNNPVDFFGFKKHPFSLTPDYSFYFLSRRHSEIVKGIFAGIMQNRGVFLLTGEVGTGKTITSRVLMEKMSKGFMTAYVLNPFLSPDGLVRNIADEFGLKHEGVPLNTVISHLHAMLIHSMKNGRGAIVFIDEAQHLPDESLEMLRVLTNLETNSRKLLQFVLIGQNELIGKLSRRHLRQIAQRVALRCELTPLSLGETHDYIFHRIRQAGGLGKIEFSRPSIYHIYKVTRGFPRSINVLMDNVLSAAAAKSQKIIDVRTVRSGYRQMLPFPLRFLPYSLSRAIRGGV